MPRTEKLAFRRGVLALLGFCSLAIFPAIALAHPMGNFTINHYSGIRLENGLVEVRYFIDMAEIPTFQELQRSGLTGRLDDPKLQEYLSSQGQVFLRGLRITMNGVPVSLNLATQDVIFPTGAGDLPTMKFGFVYHGEVLRDCRSASCQLNYEDTNFAGHAGWKEIVLVPGTGVSVSDSTAPKQDRSGELSSYPTDLINSPPQQLEAQANFSFAGSGSDVTGAFSASNNKEPTGGAHQPSVAVGDAPLRDLPHAEVKLRPNQQGTPRNSFTELVRTKEISLGIALLAALISAGLGALHALEPGHGKTIVAAYLVGSRGTARHALLLGTIVTAAHTAGVYLLGAITIYAQKYILPERIYPFLGVLSGALIAGMGCYLLLQRYLGEEFSHRHDDYSVAIESQSTNNTPTSQSRKVSAKQLVLLGVTGGIIPCPAALVVLLSAVALHRTVFGLYLIVAFSLGLATVLIGMGMVTVHAGRLMSRLHLEGPLLQKWLPMGSAATITFLGCGIALRSLTNAGLLHLRLWG